MLRGVGGERHRIGLERGREAFDRQAWADAVGFLTEADQEGSLGLEDLERLAEASYLIGRYADSMELSRRSYRESMRAGDVGRAARSAFWVAIEHLGQGEMAPAAGWLAKVERLVGDGESAEAGYLQVAAAAQSLAMGDAASAVAANERAVEIGTRVGDADLVLLAGVGVGESLIGLGEVERGIRVMDEVMVDVTSGGASPVIVGIAYCSVIAACHQVFDLRRAQEWTAALDRWCESQPQLVHFRGQCLLNRAELRQFHGAWEEAADEARQASERLGADPSLGEAIYQMAELHRLRGEFVDAEAAYRQASRLGRQPEPGVALLRLAQGEHEVAAATMARATDEAAGVFARARLLDPFVEVMLATGSTAAARMAADELVGIAEAVGAPLLTATAQRAHGAVLLAEGHARAALAALRPSWTAWQSLDAPYEAARTRVLIGMACRALDDSNAAALELDAAADVFRDLGARPDLARVEALIGPPASVGGLTARELEVLRLVAAGKTNRAIAGELVISDRTVARHLSNIFDKLDVPSRSAATAWAYEHGLVASTG
ncbi:MAG TPA: LuxR C-terminal-related transcriptional regulator [Candidatus Limnocylindria bacterium]|nr:LuxR C-terminal-related transcriptional regulator [Candidatus Limnocylindria bacterium]